MGYGGVRSGEGVSLRVVHARVRAANPFFLGHREGRAPMEAQCPMRYRWKLGVQVELWKKIKGPITVMSQLSTASACRTVDSTLFPARPARSGYKARNPVLLYSQQPWLAELSVSALGHFERIGASLPCIVASRPGCDPIRCSFQRQERIGFPGPPGSCFNSANAWPFTTDAMLKQQMQCQARAAAPRARRIASSSGSESSLWQQRKR